MGFGKLRFRRSFGQVKSQFRGAIPKHFPLVQHLLDLYPATAAYSAYDLGNKRGSVTEAEGTVVNPVQRWRRGSDDALQMWTAAQIASGTALTWAGTTAYLLTEYDQSGNGYDLTQTTAANQPLVVSGGALTVDDYGNVAPSFDGATNYMTSSSYYAASMSVFAVLETDAAVNTPNYMRAIHLCDGVDSFQITRGGDVDAGDYLSKNTSFQASATAYNHGAIDGVNLLTAITNTDTTAYTDGLLQSNVADVIGSGTSATTTIGARDDLLSSSFFYGKPAAILVYASDETANRAAIEAKLSTIVTTAIS